MARDSLVLIYVSLIVTQLAVVYSQENIDWSTPQDELRKVVASVRKKCMAETGVALVTLEEAETGVFPEDRKLACYFNCVLEKAGVVKKGKINYKLIGKMMPPAFKSIGVTMLDECKDVGGKDSCEIAFNFNECLYNSNPVAYFVA